MRISGCIWYSLSITMAYFEITGLPVRTPDSEFGPTVNFELEQGRGLTVLSDTGTLPASLADAITGYGVFSGEIMLNNMRIDPLPSKGRNIGILGTQPGVVPNRTVKENLEVALKKSQSIGYKESATDDTEKIFLVEHELTNGPLAGFGDVIAETLDSISRTLLALTRLLLGKPDLIVIYRLPSPGFVREGEAACFNPGLQLDCLIEIKTLLRRFRATWISILTDPACVQVLSDRIAIFAQGNLVQEGSLRECINAPGSKLVADYLAFPSINYKKIRIERDGPFVMLRSGRYGFSVSEYAKRHLAGREGEDAIVGVRPEDLGVRAYETGDPTVRNLARVTSIDIVPGGQLVHLDADGAEWVAMTDISRIFFTGQLVELRPNPDRIYLFHPVNGVSLLD
ncbi:MAG: hypothetical protein NTY09_04585 [bacterium]|nr:hypothetical protein [bacterium]